MNMKRLFFGWVAVMAVLTSLWVSPGRLSASELVSIGDNASIQFVGSSSVRYSSNIFRSRRDEVEDVIWTLSPGFVLDVGRGLSGTSFGLSTQYNIVRYEDFSRLNSELLSLSANASHNTGRLNLRSRASFRQRQSSTGDGDVRVQDDLIKSDFYSADINGSYRLSPKFGFSAGFVYSGREYTTFSERFADRDISSFPMSISYELTSKVDMLLGYTYSVEDIGDADNGLRFVGAYKNKRHRLNLGLRGDLLPKLSGTFRVGYNTRTSEDSVILRRDSLGRITTRSETNREDTNALGLHADLNWAMTPKLISGLQLSHDFGIGGEGYSTETTRVSVSGRYSISRRISASSVFGYVFRDYSNISREDNEYFFSARLGYKINEHMSFSTGYEYSESNSNFGQFDYETHSVSARVSLRY